MRGAVGFLAIASLCVIGCAHTPTQPGERADLTRAAETTLQRMEAKDPGLRPLIDRSVGYIVFPAVGEGGFVVGGGAGNGVVFEHGRPTGFAELRHGEVGALAGGQRYSELVVVRDRGALESMKSGRFDFGARASAIIVRTGASANATFERGVAVFMEPVRGAMVNASLSGQRIRFTL